MKTKLSFLFGLLFALDGMAQDVYLKGNIAPAGGIQLSQTSSGQYAQQVTLDDSGVFLFSDKFVFFECPDQGYRSGNIRINGGTYQVTFSMSDKRWSFTAPIDDYRISAFGSSVCNGQGANGNKGYAYLYGEQLKERYASETSANPFYVSGISIGGNNTQNLLDRYDEMTRDHARYVIVGLSMGNEGIHESGNKQQTLNQFSTNMQTIIRRIKADGKVPVVMNNYTRGDFTLEDYSYIKQMNLLIHEWDVSSVNTLGAIDDGKGHWASGYQQDNAHPTTNGHKEFFYAMPPSLFDAIAAGKAQPVRDLTQAMTLSDGSVITFSGEGTVHPFTITVRFKGNMKGRLFTYRMATGGRQGFVDVDAEGHLVYTTTTNRTIATTGTVKDDGWHYATLTHYYAQGRTLLYLDGEEAAQLQERISSKTQWVVGDETTDTQRTLSELFFWRSALSPEEVQAVVSGKMLKSSLELYVPATVSLENKAMSLNSVTYSGVASAIRTPSVTRHHGDAFYGLSGRRLTQPQTGVVIQNGRKHLVH